MNKMSFELTSFHFSEAHIVIHYCLNVAGLSLRHITYIHILFDNKG